MGKRSENGFEDSTEEPRRKERPKKRTEGWYGFTFDWSSMGEAKIEKRKKTNEPEKEKLKTFKFKEKTINLF